VLFVACLSSFCGSNVFAGPIYPPETVYDGPKPVPPLPRPGYRQSVIDPTFGTKITRISGDEMNPPKPTRLQHDYSKDQPWNKDMTLIKLSGAMYILNAMDYSVFKQWSFHDESRWSTVDPDILFYINGSEFRKVNVRTGVDTLIHTFPGKILMGPWEGNLSIGDRYVVFNMGGQSTAVVYDILHDAIIATGNVGTAAEDWMSISADGNYVLLSNAGTVAGLQLRDRNLTPLRTLFANASHGDIGQDQAGNPTYAQVGSTEKVRLDTGDVTKLLPGYAFQGHLSMRSYLRPGWASISTNSGNREIFAVKLDNRNIVQRFAHTRTTEATYDSQAKGVISPDGSKVMWNSDWGGGTVYAYVAEMPGNSGPPEATPPLAPTNLQILP
jgi:hypothetical protein